jgi:DNA-binding CsgD family transcriptional regulator
MTAEEALRELEPLTPREMEVLELIAKGYTSDQVGKTLGISRHTVDDKRRAISSKLGVNQCQACWLVGRAGLG